MTDVRTYLNVPYEDNSKARKLGAVWDDDARQWFIPGDVPSERFREFHDWFSEACWEDAPECPGETDPVKWGRALFPKLKRWAIKWKMAPESLAYWDVTQGTPPIEECCSEDAVVQILWPRGPSLWAMRLLQRRDYEAWGGGDLGYYLEAIDDWSFAVSKA